MPTFLTAVVIGLPLSSLLRPSPLAKPAPDLHLSLPRDGRLLALAAFLTLGPVFLEAPLVRIAPMAAILATAPLLLMALALTRRPAPGRQAAGFLLVGFVGSWLGGALFWGWFRAYPFWHLPIEGFALPLALGGLRSRWRLGAWFYLASFLGTAITDGLIAATGLMAFWPPVVLAPPGAATELLRDAADSLLHPVPLLILALGGGWIAQLAHQLWAGDGARRVAAAALASTLAVDGLFLLAALLAPRLSGLI